MTTWWLGHRCRRRLKHMKGLRLFFHELILIFLLLFFLMETRRNWPPGTFYRCLTKPSVNGINTNTHREPLSRQAPGRAFLFPSRFQGHQPLPVEKTEKLLWPWRYEKHHCCSSKQSQSPLGLRAKPIEIFSGFGLSVTVKQQNSVPACFPLYLQPDSMLLMGYLF